MQNGLVVETAVWSISTHKTGVAAAPGHPEEAYLSMLPDWRNYHDFFFGGITNPYKRALG